MDASGRIEQALSEAVAGGLPGIAAAARLPDGTVVEAAAGVRGLGDAAPMTPDTVFWIASCTKALTTAAVLQLVEAGRVELDAPVSRWLPGLAAPKVLTGFDAAGAPQLVEAKTPITVRHLLAHTSGLGYEFCSEPLTRYVETVGPYPRGEGPDAPLLFEPGSGWSYGIGTDWAGKLIEAVAGERLDHHLERRLFAPLGMGETGFFPTDEQRSRLAAMHGRGADGRLAPIAFGMPAEPHFGMGGGGLYSTARDYLSFLEAVLGVGAGALSAGVVASMRQTQWEGPEVGVLAGVNPGLCAGFDPFPGEAKRWGLGFLINPKPGPNGRAAGSLAWAGLANCYYWADPASGAAGVFLAQLLPFGDPAALEAFGAFERAVYSA
ncbi:MAG TPA: serine hydrolase domain-containing protein [Caulobacteraceae bacterium]|nr:serine hydrolase domain-containing protein [Caulobacteraceae bacterium]